MLSMYAKDIPEIKEVMEEWKKEVEALETQNFPHNTLDNSLNSRRFELEQKYKKRIDDIMKKHSSE